ncbi:hypothetical protein PQQ63_15235 [Paraburkholderia metrosideri]|uniref:HTH cro/C1-type domain-containing protein n=1 Tax=Paraburkholderia metrosideri TaxID=580937 RepID=A0ABW9DSV3_9BURK
MKRRDLTPEEIEDATRLAAAWESYKDTHPGVSQEWLGNASGIGGQSAVSQYLLAKIPLNLEALLRLCSVLGEKPEVISPRLIRQFFGPGGPRFTALKDESEVQVYDDSLQMPDGVKRPYTANAEEIKTEIMRAVAAEGLSNELLNALAWMIRAGTSAPVRGDQHHTKTVKLKKHGRATGRATGTG